MRSFESLSTTETEYVKQRLSINPNLPFSRFELDRATLVERLFENWRMRKAFFVVAPSSIEQGFAIIERLEWDSRLLEMHAARLHYIDVPTRDFTEERLRQLDAVASAIHQYLLGAGVELIDARISSNDLFSTRCLEKIGFHSIDSLVTLGANAKTLRSIVQAKPALTSACVIRPLQPEDEDTVAAITRIAFSDQRVIKDRFFLEPSIQHHAAENLFEEWIRNSIKKHHQGKGVVLSAVMEDQVVGYIAVEKNEIVPGLWYDSLNAIAENARGKGIYKALIYSAIEHVVSHEAAWLITKTQVSTERVINSWLHMGASLLESQLTLHWTKDCSNRISS